MALASPLPFAGTGDEQALARRVWDVMAGGATL